jgi:hypothetical protein
MLFVLPLFISLAYLVSTASRTTSSTVNGGYSYNNKLTCNCDADTGGTVESKQLLNCIALDLILLSFWH